MQIIINYIGKNLLKGILIIMLLLLGIDLFFYFINELRFVGIGNYNLYKACEFIILTIPRKLYIISPWAVLIGSLLILGSMAKSQELLFIRSIGMSANKIAFCSSVYILGFTICIFIIGEWLAPKAEILAQKRKTIAISKGNSIYTGRGIWTRVKNKFIHIATIKDHNSLNDITIYEFDDSLRLKKSTFAKTAKLIQEKNCKSDQECHSLWKMQEIVITDFTNLLNNNEQNNHHHPKANKLNSSPQITTVKLPTIEIQNLLDLNILRASNIKHLDRLSVSNLDLIIKDRLANNLTVIDYKIAYWKKIIQPFSILIMGYLAVPFVLGPLRSSSNGTRLLIGVVLGIGFYLLNALLCPLATVVNFPPVIAIILPSMIFLSLAVYLSAKV